MSVLDARIQLGKRDCLVGTGVDFRIASQCLRNTSVFVGQYARQRFEEIRREGGSFPLGQIERAFLHFNDCGHGWRIPPLEVAAQPKSGRLKSFERPSADALFPGRPEYTPRLNGVTKLNMQDDLKRLQGTWRIANLEVDGRPTPQTMLENAEITIKGSRFTTTRMGAAYAGTLRLDPSSEPPQLDMKFDAGPEKGNTNLGIYQLKSDTWRLCLSTRGDVRPSKFKTVAGSGFALETLTRGKAAPKVKAKSTKPAAPQMKATGSAPATEFEGDWQMVSAVMNGVPLDASTAQWVKRKTSGNESTVTAGSQTMMTMTFTNDASTSPKAIDYVNTAGANKGKTQLGIYAFEGDRLRICMAAPGAARPAQFMSAPKSGATLTEWRRTEPKP